MTKTITVNSQDIKDLGIKVSDTLPALETMRLLCDSRTFSSDNIQDVLVEAYTMNMILQAVKDQTEVLYKQLDEVAFELLNCEETLVTSENEPNSRTKES